MSLMFAKSFQGKNWSDGEENLKSCRRLKTVENPDSLVPASAAFVESHRATNIDTDSSSSVLLQAFVVDAWNKRDMQSCLAIDRSGNVAFDLSGNAAFGFRQN